jgi:predicted transposase YbfD/YdcC
MLLCSAQTKPRKVKMDSNTEAGVVINIGSLYLQLEQLKDSRKPRGLRYPLVTILVLMLLAKLCGQDQVSGMAEWVKHRGEQLIELLKLSRKTMPHHSTYRRILADIIQVEELEQISRAYWSGKETIGQQVLVAMDGKVLRGTLDEDQKGTYLLAAYLPGEGIVLMEVAIDGKGSEIPAAPRLLKSLDLRNKVVMGDALHTQREISIQIVEAGGEYIWFAKGNQPQLKENICLWFEPEGAPLPGMAHLPKDLECVTDTCKGHGRIEVRTLTVSSQLKAFLDWPYGEQVFKLERRFTFPKTKAVQEQVVFGITSLSRTEVAPSRLLEMIRSYWGIENGLHYRRDVTFQEDRSRMTKGHTGQVMACLNNLVLGILLAKQKSRYIPPARRFLDAHPEHALALISQL